MRIKPERKVSSFFKILALGSMTKLISKEKVFAIKKVTKLGPFTSPVLNLC